MVPHLILLTTQPSKSSPFMCEDIGHQAKRSQSFRVEAVSLVGCWIGCAIGWMQGGGKAGASWLKLTSSQSGTNILSQGGQL